MMGVQKIFEERPTAKAKAGGSFLSVTEGAKGAQFLRTRITKAASAGIFRPRQEFFFFVNSLLFYIKLGTSV